MKNIGQNSVLEPELLSNGQSMNFHLVKWLIGACLENLWPQQTKYGQNAICGHNRPNIAKMQF